jgi:SAM-dependent methyltransferase
VTATDIDVSWLDDDGYEVLFHDAEHEPPPGSYDLVHTRLVLTHLPGRDRALHTMAAGLRPGGWMIVEDFDVGLQPRAGLDAPSPERSRANRVRDGFVELLAQRGVDLHFGRSLPSRLRALGLVDVRADAYLPLAMPATLALELANLRQVHSALTGAGFHQTELDAHAEGLEHGLLDIATPPLVSAWGRRPTEQERRSATNGGVPAWPAS